MFKQAMVGVVAGLLCASGAATAADASQPLTTTAARQTATAHAATTQTELAALRCSRYPASVFTHTHISLDKYFQRRGTSNAAHIHVTSHAGKPRGVMYLTIRQVAGGSHVYHRHGTLQSGRVTVSLPRWADVGRYRLTAHYNAERCSKWMDNDSRVLRYHVTPRS
jgi:hypothetical protein